jgi:hypothetical protein
VKLPNLVFKPFPIPGLTGVQANYKDWSVILHTGSYGNQQGLYEVMGPGFDDGGGVAGYLTLPEVMVRIALEEKENCHEEIEG